jgi:hypothetical protein
MSETGILTAKIMAGLGGLIGGMTLMAFMKPKTILDATLRGGVSTGTGIIFAGPILEWLEMSPNVQMILMFAFIIGFLSWGVLSLVAQIFINAQKKEHDLLDVVNKGRSGNENEK